ncbi:molybdenum cofactor guanylyltransferase [Halalkalirubrum salinum]|uniref:molybdenum cofactor guanylyltransferase n=1 Tax=Halalkalirubrum salinum TaxID=2563889 RepID=UPI0010FB91D1|nr:molybdenum cofactor guanylyltransferase [Halalkalirubrum salinum]
MTDHPRTGVVLAGGYSTRFGEADKALAEIDSIPMVARVVNRLSEVVDSIVVSCRDDQQPGFERSISELDLDLPVRFAIDPEPDRGPLAGIKHSFDTVDSTYAAVVACDMPFVDPAFIAFLFDQAGGHDAAVPELEDGHQQPMQAVYHVGRTVTVATQRLAADSRSLHGTLSELDTVVIPPTTVSDRTTWRSLHDLNSRDEFDRVT